MKHATDLLSHVDSRRKPSAVALHLNEDVWGPEHAHPAAAAVRLGAMPGQGLANMTLPDMPDLLGTRSDASVQPVRNATHAVPTIMMTDDDLDIIDERPASSQPAATVIEVVTSAMQRLHAEFEKRDEALRLLNRRAAEEERRRVAELRAKKAALQVVLHSRRRGGLDHTPALEPEDAAADEADTLLLADYLPSLLNDMVALVGGFGVVADGPIAVVAAATGAVSGSVRTASGAAASRGAGYAFDNGSLSDLLVSATAAQANLRHKTIARQESKQGGAGLARGFHNHSAHVSAAAVATAGSGGGSSIAVRRAMREQLAAAQRRQSSQLDARRKGFGSIVQLGVARARK